MKILIFIGFFLATLFNESQQAQEFGGTVFQANSKYSTPKGVKIQWMNFLLLFGVSFDMNMESNDISETNFKIKVGNLEYLDICIINHNCYI